MKKGWNFLIHLSQYMDNLRRIVRNILKENYGPAIMYSAVVIEESLEEQKMNKLAQQYVPEGWSIPPHYHMTISQGPIPQSLRLRGDLNKEVELTINMIGTSDKSIAFGTFGYYSKNEMPHITIAFNKAVGGVPADSKEINNWQSIDKVIVKGVIREIAEGNQVVKEVAETSIESKDLKIDLSSQKIILGNKQIGIIETSKRNNYLTLNKIFIDKAYQGKGYGSKAMKELIVYANKNNLILALTPDEVWGSKKSILIKWYTSLGFIMNKGSKKDFEIMQLMYKLPDKLDEVSVQPATGSRSPFGGIPSEFPKSQDYDQFGNTLDSTAK